MENRMQGEEPGTRDPTTTKAWIDEIHAVASKFAREIAEAGERILALGENWDGDGTKPCKLEI